jgi:hypothetical protein
MRELVVSSSSTEELSVEERNLLSVAYKNVIGSRRAAWRTLNAGVDEGKFDDLLLAYRKQVESELSDVCLDVLNLLEDTLVKTNTKVSTSDGTLGHTETKQTHEKNAPLCSRITSLSTDILLIFSLLSSCLFVCSFVCLFVVCL